MIVRPFRSTQIVKTIDNSNSVEQQSRLQVQGYCNGGRRRAAAAGLVVQPLRGPRQGGAGAQGAQQLRLRVRRGGPLRQERPPAPVQPGAQEGAGPHPRRPPGVRVARHRAVRRRDLGIKHRRHSSSPPRRRPRPRHGSLLGSLHRRQGTYQSVGADAACYFPFFFCFLR